MKKGLRSTALVALLGAVLGAAPGASASNGPVLSLVQRDLIDPVPAGSQMVSVIEISNLGQASATEVTVTLEILEDQSCNDGACPPIASYRSGCDQVQGRFMTCAFAEIPAGVMIPMAIVVDTTAPGVVTLSADATTSGAEPVSSVRATEVIALEDDGTPPTSYAFGEPEDWVNYDVNLELRATDDAGIPSIEYWVTRRMISCGWTCSSYMLLVSFDTVPGPTLHLPFSAAESEFNIMFSAIDGAGNVERPRHEAWVRIDKRKPDGNVTVPGRPGYDEATGEVRLPEVHGGVVVFEGRAGDGNGSGLPRGPHEMPVYGVVCFDVRGPLDDRLGCVPAVKIDDAKDLYEIAKRFAPGLYRVAIHLVDRAGNEYTSAFREFIVGPG